MAGFFNPDTEGYRCSLENDDFSRYSKTDLGESSRYGIISERNGNLCSAQGCRKKKHPKSKYCPYHRIHRPRSAEAYLRMVTR